MQETALGSQLVTLISSSNPKNCYCYLASNPSEIAKVYCFVNPNDV